MAKERKIEVKGVQISIKERDNADFISLSDIANGTEGGTGLIEKWIRNKNTLEFLAVWETIHNAQFNSTEFDGIRIEAGTNRFMMSVKQWTQKTNAIGITAAAGRYGGTYAHQDIAFEFCSWLSPEFKLLLIKEFQRLKSEEAQRLYHEWDIRRMLTKVNYRIHTEAIKEQLIPQLPPQDAQGIVYANEAEMLNLALFGTTSKQWRTDNPDLVAQGKNIRDFADLHELIVLSNLESYNAILLHQKMPAQTRLAELHKTALMQLQVLRQMQLSYLEKIKSPHAKLLEKPD